MSNLRCCYNLELPLVYNEATVTWSFGTAIANFDAQIFDLDKNSSVVWFIRVAHPELAEWFRCTIFSLHTPTLSPKL